MSHKPEVFISFHSHVTSPSNNYSTPCPGSSCVLPSREPWCLSHFFLVFLKLSCNISHPLTGGPCQDYFGCHLIVVMIILNIRNCPRAARIASGRRSTQLEQFTPGLFLLLTNFHSPVSQRVGVGRKKGRMRRVN